MFSFSTLDTIGYVAGTISTIAFLPQVIKTLRTRSARDLSTVTVIALISASVLWVSYGVISDQWPIIIPNITTLLLTGTIMIYKIREG